MTLPMLSQSVSARPNRGIFHTHLSYRQRDAFDNPTKMVHHSLRKGGGTGVWNRNRIILILVNIRTECKGRRASSGQAHRCGQIVKIERKITYRHCGGLSWRTILIGEVGNSTPGGLSMTLSLSLPQVRPIH